MPCSMPWAMPRSMPCAMPWRSHSASHSFALRCSVVISSSSSNRPSPMLLDFLAVGGRKQPRHRRRQPRRHRGAELAPHVPVGEHLRQPSRHRLHPRRRLRRGGRALDAEHRQRRVAFGRIVSRRPPRVKQPVGGDDRQPRRAVGRDRHGPGGARRRPRLRPGVDHHGQRAQPAIGVEPVLAPQMLAQQAGVGERARRHVGVHRGLELEQQHERARVGAGIGADVADAPDRVGVALDAGARGRRHPPAGSSWRRAAPWR